MTTFNIFHNPKHCQQYAAGEVIFEQGDKGEFMCDVISGEVSLQRDGKELIRLGVGEIFGETGLINNEEHSVTVIALSDCEVAKISKSQFTFMVTETPNFALKVMRVLAERLSQETAKNSRSE